jgi:hypothetical protein
MIDIIRIFDWSFIIFLAENFESLAEELDLFVVTSNQNSDELSSASEKNAREDKDILFSIEKFTEIFDWPYLVIEGVQFDSDCCVIAPVDLVSSKCFPIFFSS